MAKLKKTVEQKTIEKLEREVEGLKIDLEIKSAGYDNLYNVYKPMSDEIDLLKKELKESQAQSRKLLSLLLKLGGE